MIKNSLVTLLLLSLLVLPLHGQQPQKQQPLPPKWPGKESSLPPPPPPGDEDDVVRITTSLVQLDAVVIKDGKHVTDLKAEDFEIFEDGRAQTITNFSYISSVPAAAASPANIAATPPVKNKKNKNGPPVLPAVVRPQDTRRTIAIVVDDLGLSLESMGPIKSQLRKFVDEQILPSDLVAIIRTGGEVGALQQFTTDKRLLYRAIERLRRNPCSRMGISVLPPVGSGNNGTGLCSVESFHSTTQSLQFIVQGMRELPGRKSLVLLSDYMPSDTLDLSTLERLLSRPGAFLFSNEAALKRVAELAIRASVVIYAVDTRGLQVTGQTAADNFSAGGTGVLTVGTESIVSRSQALLSDRAHQLQDGRAGSDLIARETGGFLVRGSNDFGLQRVMRDQEGYYLIAYRPKGTSFDRRFHHIKARVKRPGLTVRTREGFFGATDEQTRPVERTNRDKMNIALMSPFGAVDIEVRLTALFANMPATGSLLRSLLYFQARDLTFTDEPDGWHQSTFNLSGIIFGDNGAVVNQVNETRTLRLQGKEYDRALRDGIVYQLDMPIKNPGAYQFRVAVRDAASSRIGTAGQFVEVPDLKSALALSGITVSSGVAPDAPKTNSASGTAPSADSQTTADTPMANPANRRFRQGSNLFFGYAIYKAQLDNVTHLPSLTAQAKIFHDGKLVYEGGLKPIDLAGQTDLERITSGGGLHLGILPPGEYILQIVVNDALAQEKNRTTTQWIDFEIVQ
jgi:VWFA-related protein